jgi:hypothetical protein
MLSIAILSIIPNVIMPSVIVLIVAAPFNIHDGKEESQGPML